MSLGKRRPRAQESLSLPVRGALNFPDGYRDIGWRGAIPPVTGMGHLSLLRFDASAREDLIRLDRGCCESVWVFEFRLVVRLEIFGGEMCNAFGNSGFQLDGLICNSRFVA